MLLLKIYYSIIINFRSSQFPSWTRSTAAVSGSHTLDAHVGYIRIQVHMFCTGTARKNIFCFSKMALQEVSCYCKYLLHRHGGQGEKGTAKSYCHAFLRLWIYLDKYYFFKKYINIHEFATATVPTQKIFKKLKNKK